MPRLSTGLTCESPCHDLALAAYPTVPPYVYNCSNRLQVTMTIRKRLQRYATDHNLVYDMKAASVCKACVNFSKNELNDQILSNDSHSTASDNVDSDVPTTPPKKVKKRVSKPTKYESSSSSSIVFKNGTPELGDGLEEEKELTSVTKRRRKISSSSSSSPSKNGTVPLENPSEEVKELTSTSIKRGRPSKKFKTNTEEKVEILDKRVGAMGMVKYLVTTFKTDPSGSSSRSLTSWERPEAISKQLIQDFEKSSMLATFDKLQSSNSQQDRDQPAEVPASEKNFDSQTVSVVTKFEGKAIEKIESILYKADERYFAVKFVNQEEISLVRMADANINFPQEVITFYQNRVEWRDPDPDSSCEELESSKDEDETHAALVD